MKRPITSLALTALAVGAFAQANFTIVRPVENSRVREKVKILFPKGSIPAGAYVGIFLNGQLIDAVVPPVKGKYQEYILDTKGRGLADTPAGKPDRLEAKLYVNYNDQPRIVRTSSVDLNIANVASIRVPNAGFKLRYRFQPGTELVYRLTQRVAQDTISESQNKLGGRPAELPLDTETIRMKYSVDNAYPDGSGLVRMQPVLPKDKNYVVITNGNDATPTKFYDSDVLAIYMRLSSTGKEIFGSIPAAWPIEGVVRNGGTLKYLIADYPLPSLPEKSVRPGDSWQTRFQDKKVDLQKLFRQTSVVRGVGPARGEFLGVEWEMGHPCAKIHNSISEAQMTDEDKKLAKKGAQIAGDKVKIDETVWFAMDTRQVIKVVRDTTLETKQEGAGGGAYGGGGGYPGGSPGGYPGSGGRGGTMPGGGGGRGDVTGPALPPDGLMLQRPGFPGRGAGGSGGRPSGFPGQGGGYGSGAAAEAIYIRIRFQQIFVLEG